MRRVFEVDVLRCPRCNAGPMRILAAIHPPTTTEAILNSLGLPTRAPREPSPQVLVRAARRVAFEIPVLGAADPVELSGGLLRRRWIRVT